jgi:23S rRNA pseudouridine2605 synthase
MQPAHGLARVLSKRGLCSRSEAERWIREGRVSIAGRTCTDPERRTVLDARGIAVDGKPVDAVDPVYLVLNKCRGDVTTRRDERGRPTVYRCLDDPSLPWVAPVGRLDQASEGLLLFSNDSEWAAGITSPDSGTEKIYHVQIDRVGDDGLLASLRAGIEDNGEWLEARRVDLLRTGARSSWLEVVLCQGRNRQIRRMLATLDVGVQRLVRTGIGPVALGDLAKGQWRKLRPEEVRALDTHASMAASRK